MALWKRVFLLFNFSYEKMLSASQIIPIHSLSQVKKKSWSVLFSRKYSTNGPGIPRIFIRSRMIWGNCFSILHILQIVLEFLQNNDFLENIFTLNHHVVSCKRNTNSSSSIYPHIIVKYKQLGFIQKYMLRS